MYKYENLKYIKIKPQISKSNNEDMILVSSVIATAMFRNV